MKRFAAGLIVGVVLSSATLASAQMTLGRFTGRDLMNQPRILRLGYAIGISDAMQAMASTIREAKSIGRDTSVVAESIVRIAECFQRSATTVEEFVTLAELRWTQQPMYSAASTLLAKACD